MLTSLASGAHTAAAAVVLLLLLLLASPAW